MPLEEVDDGALGLRRCEERVVDIVSVEDGVSPVAPAQQAVLRVYQCLADADQGQGEVVHLSSLAGVRVVDADVARARV